MSVEGAGFRLQGCRVQWAVFSKSCRIPPGFRGLGFRVL